MALTVSSAYNIWLQVISSDFVAALLGKFLVHKLHVQKLGNFILHLISRISFNMLSWLLPLDLCFHCHLLRRLKPLQRGVGAYLELLAGIAGLRRSRDVYSILDAYNVQFLFDSGCIFCLHSLGSFAFFASFLRAHLIYHQFLTSCAPMSYPF